MPGVGIRIRVGSNPSTEPEPDPHPDEPPQWVKDLTSPSGDVPPIALDFANSRYWFFGTEQTDPDGIILEDPNFGSWDPSSITSLGLSESPTNQGTVRLRYPLLAGLSAYLHIQTDGSPPISNPTAPNSTIWSVFYYSQDDPLPYMEAMVQPVLTSTRAESKISSAQASVYSTGGELLVSSSAPDLPSLITVLFTLQFDPTPCSVIVNSTDPVYADPDDLEPPASPTTIGFSCQSGGTEPSYISLLVLYPPQS